MTGREIMRRAVEFAGPERIGLTFSGDRINDCVGGGPSPDRNFKPRVFPSQGDEEITEDEWGNIWHRFRSRTAGGEVLQGALVQWSDLEHYRFPTYDDPARYEAAAQLFATHPDKYRMGSLPGFPFAIMRYLRRMDIFFTDLMLERRNVLRLQDRVVNMLIRIVNIYADIGADGVSFCEDWGTQNRLLIHPDVWR